MPDDNRFAGLSEAVEDDLEPDDATSDPEPASESAAGDESVEATYEETTAAPQSSSDVQSTPESDETDDASDDDPAAFPFDETTKKTVYVRQETIDALEDARALVDAQLRTQHDVRDLTGREFYDAAFRLAAADTDGLIEEIRDEREE